MKKVRVFTKTYTERLFKESQIDTDLYLKGEFSITEEAYAIGETGISIDEEVLNKINGTDGSSKDDVENAILLYEAMEINLTTASDQRLWTCLTHTLFWDYMKKRWPLESLDKDRRLSRIKDRYHLRSLSLNNLSRNGISRLWWMAHLTADEDRKDKYELTRVLGSRQDLIAGLLERFIGSNLNIRKSILNFLSENKMYLENEDKRRELLKQINLVGGVKNLPLLDQAEIIAEIKRIT